MKIDRETIALLLMIPLVLIFIILVVVAVINLITIAIYALVEKDYFALSVVSVLVAFVCFILGSAVISNK